MGDSFLFHKWLFSHYHHMVEGVEELFGKSGIKEWMLSLKKGKNIPKQGKKFSWSCELLFLGREVFQAKALCVKDCPSQQEVIEVKWGHNGGALTWREWCLYKRRRQRVLILSTTQGHRCLLCLSVSQEGNSDQELNQLHLELGLLASRIVRRWTSVV